MSNATSLLIGIAFFIGLAMNACTGMETTSGNNGSQVYSEDYEKMKEVVKQAIRDGNMIITYVDDSKDDSITLLIGRERFVNNEEIQVEKGEVRVINLDDEKTQVEVDNPDYHFSVPNHQKEDYQRLIFTRINSILENS